MDTIVKIIGFVIAVMAIVYLFKPEVMRRILQFFQQGKRLYFVGLLRFVLAAVFLIAARECYLTWLIIAFGVLLLISGMLVFVISLERLKSYLAWWQKQSVLYLRLVSILALAIGAVIVYAA